MCCIIFRMPGDTKRRGSDRYILLPSPYRPKYFILARNFRSFQKGLSFYRPVSFKSLLKRKLILYSFPALSLTGRRVQGEEIIDRLGLRSIKKISQNTGQWASLYMPPGGDKVVVQLLNGREEVFAYMKIGLSESGNERIKREEEALNFLREAGFSAFEFPGVLERGTEGERNFVILTSPPRLEAPRKIALKFLLPGLRQLFKLQSKEHEISNIPHLREILRKAETYLPKNLQEKFIEILEGLRGLTLPSGCLHSDFKLWNIFINPSTGKPFVIDWEFFRCGGLPLWDIFCFLLLPRLLVFPPRSINFRPLLPLLKRSSLALGFKDLPIEKLFKLYLIDTFLFLENHGHPDRRTEKTIQNLLSYLKNLR